MGMDFSALYRYSGFRHVRGQIAELQRESLPEFAKVLELWRRSGFSDGYTYNAWIDPQSRRQVRRPKQPNIEVALRMREGFFIYFGRDTIYLYHLLRWDTFLTDFQWRAVMLDACAAFARHFNASDCILAHDCHPAMGAFRHNLTFEACLQSVPAEEGEVETIDKLYTEIEDHETDLAMRPGGRIVLRPRDKPLPEGWVRPTIWDSKGFWRYRWWEHEKEHSFSAPK